MSRPLCSIVMPAFNAAATIAEAIESVRAQSCADWELLVVDDCSSDGTAAIVGEYAEQDARIRYFRMDVNSGGPAGPRNRGISEAARRFIAFLDGDDVWYREKLQRQLTAMRRFAWGLSCTGFDVVRVGKGVVGTYIPPLESSYEHVLGENSLGCLSVAYDTDLLGKRYFPSCGHEDYALWLQILREGNVAHGIQESLCAYRLTPGSVSRNKLRVLRFFYSIYRHREGFSAPRSAFLTIRYALKNAAKYRRAGRPVAARGGQ